MILQLHASFDLEITTLLVIEMLKMGFSKYSTLNAIVN